MSGYYVRRRRAVSGMGSGPYVRPSNGMGLNAADIPILGFAYDWVDGKVRSAVEYIVQKYAEFEKASLDAPAQLAEAERVARVLSQTDATPTQLAQAQQFLKASQDAVNKTKDRTAVDQVVAWAKQVGSTMGLGVPVLIPLWVAGASAVAVYSISSALSAMSQAKSVRLALQAGFTPEQIAKIGVGRSSVLDEAKSLITYGAIAIGAMYLLPLVMKKRS